MEKWNDGMMEGWGKESWNIGMVERWNNGKVEDWYFSQV